MTGLIDAAFASRRVVMTFMVVAILFGAISYMTIPREAEPDIPIPVVSVAIPFPGVSPEDADRILVRPTDLELRGLEGLKEMNSYAYESMARIFLEFETSVDIDTALIDVREKVDAAKSKYPSDAEEPIIEEFNAQTLFPIISIVLSGNAPERSIYRTARDLKDKLEAVSGVLEANLQGARDELLEIVIDPATLSAYNLTQSEIVNAILSNNRLVAAGAVETGTGRFSVKLPGVFKTVEDVMELPLKVDGDIVIRAGDIAEVRRTFVDVDGYARLNRQPAIAIDITKRIGANILDTIDEVRSIVEAEAETFPDSIKVEYINDTSIYINEQLNTLTASVITAIVLVMIVVVAAMGLRSAFMVGFAIPTSFLIGFILLVVNGYTLNFMIMFGLVLAVGMLVDAAIVIVEYADRRMQEGVDRTNAYMDAAKRMFWPIASSTATTLAVFIPFLFWENETGEFMKFFPITLIFVLSASFLVAIIFLPVIGSLIGPKMTIGALGRMPLSKAELCATPGVNGAYGRFISRAIEKPGLVLFSAIAIIVSIFFLFRAASPAVEFFVRAEPFEVHVFMSARGNLDADEKDAIVREVEERLTELDGVKSKFAITGAASRGDDMPADAIGILRIDLAPFEERRSGRAIMEDVRRLTMDIPGVVIEVREPPNGPPIDKDVVVQLTGTDSAALGSATLMVREFLQSHHTDFEGRQIHTYIEVEDSLPLPGVEWELTVDRAQAARLGADVSTVGGVVQMVTNGLLVDKYRPDDADDEIDIRIRYPVESRDLSELDQLRVATAQGMSPLSSFVTREARRQVDRISRRDTVLVYDVKANGNMRYEADGMPISQNIANTTVRAWLNEAEFPPGVEWRMRGADEETAAAAMFFVVAMGAALFMMAIILLMQFNSFYHAGLTLSAVVLSVFGVLLGVAATGAYISVIMTGTGIFALAGIVVNNNIVLIDTFNYNRRKLGLSVEDAVVRTAMQRMRPVLLTTITTICGLLPMAFQLNVNFAAGSVTHGSLTSNWWSLISSAIVNGLAFSTLLTLVLTPVMLALPSVMGARFAKMAPLIHRMFGGLLPFGGRKDAGPTPAE